MDQQRRFIMFFLLSMGAMYLWLNVGLPFFHPEILEQKAARQVQKQKQVPGEAGSSEVAVVQPADTSDIPPVVAPKEIKLPEFPEQTVELGSLDPESGFYLYVKLNSRGAAVDSIQLNDPRYRELTDRNVPLQLVGESAELSRKTFDLRTEAIDRVLAEKGDSLETVNWKIVEQTTLERVVFEYPAPDGSLVIRKIYELKQGEKSGRDTDTSGYQLQARLEFQNTSAAAVEMTYDLQGPVGFHLENAENTRRYLVIQAGFVSGGSIRHEQVLASEISKQARKKGGVENFQTPLRYLGVDGQYFTALLMPETDQEIQKWVDTAQPILVDRADPEERSEISFILESTEVDIPPQQTVSHQYSLYAGPKRAALLRPLDAESTIEYGWFGWISKIMVAFMNFFHNSMSLPYGLAIILLTVTVRAAMFPVSLKHAKAAKKMKEMQPRFEEIKKKYENDKEKLAKAQMELMKESGFFSGCLPMLLQIPVFFALYQALYSSVDLRMAQFLWIDNLAAPDQLFRLPFAIPWLGSDFNLLPIISVGLMILQQKMFAPPAANEEQAMQQKMMGYMMIVIGFMFYRMPAGLCIYLIASSLWAVAERKMLDWKGVHGTSGGKEPPTANPEKKPAPAPETPPKSSWLKDTLGALDAAANPGQKKPNRGTDPNRMQGGKNRGKSKR